jgi:hypothetical protein
MRDDFCAFILTHGRPDRVHTYNTLMRSGYTGKVFIVIDDEDKTEAEYRARYGDKVIQFCKAEVAARIDEGDNFNDRRAIIYARNACWDLARQVGCKYFIQLDDDYTNFALRFRSDNSGLYQAIRTTLDAVLTELVEFLIVSPALTVAMSQGGDLIGGTSEKSPQLKRKAMNSFVCCVDRQFRFFGRVNEDVNTYTTLSRKGLLFFTAIQAQLVQVNTQQNAGGMSGTYLDAGTYLKTFYSVMYAPSCVKVSTFGDPCRWGNAHNRIHHKINWHHCAPKILREEWSKPKS